MAKKPKHGIRPVDAEDKLHVRVDCEHCNEWELISDYEKNIEARNFSQEFKECPKCHTVYCSSCLPKDVCPKCAGITLNLKPSEVFVCTYCLQEWGDKGGLCNEECKYHK